MVTKETRVRTLKPWFISVRPAKAAGQIVSSNGTKKEWSVTWKLFLEQLRLKNDPDPEAIPRYWVIPHAAKFPGRL